MVLNAAARKKKASASAKDIKPLKNAGKKSVAAPEEEAEEEGFRAPFSLKSTELRTDLGLTTGGMADVLRKADARYVDNGGRPGAARCIHPSTTRKILSDRGFEFPLESLKKAAQVIALQITKGGSTKTTSAHAFGTRMSALGAKVLLVDADPQSNLTTIFALEQYGIELDEDLQILCDLFDPSRSGSVDIWELIIKITPNLHLIPNTLRGSNLESFLHSGRINIERAMALKFKELVKHYDYIIFDCAPSLSVGNAIISVFSDLIILPVYPDKLCKSGLDQTLGEIERLRSELGGHPVRSMQPRIFLNRFDSRQKMSVIYLSQLYSEYPELMYSNYIHTSSALSASVHRSQNLFEAEKSGAAADYHSLIKEIMGLDKLELRKRAAPSKSKKALREGEAHG